MSRIFRRKGRRGWWLDYIDTNGERIRRPSGTTDKTTALLALAAAETSEVRKTIGVIHQEELETKEQSKRPISEHFEEFIQFLRVSGRGETHLSGTKSHLTRLAEELGWTSILHIKEQQIIGWLDTAQTKRKNPKPLSDRTRQSYCQSITAFCRWARKRKRIGSNPIDTLSRPQVRKKSFHRRAITREEWAYLSKFLATNESMRLGMDSSERVILYELALVSALRAKEITSLTRSSFDFDRGLVRCKETKNKKAADQSLTKPLIAKLKKHLAKKMPGARAFAISDRTGFAKTIRADFEAARLAWLQEAKSVDERTKREKTDFLALKNDAGEILDFHSLRHTCGAWLAMMGLHPKVIQRIMRHSSITLTMDTYGHLFPEQETAAIKALEKATGS